MITPFVCIIVRLLGNGNLLLLFFLDYISADQQQKKRSITVEMENSSIYRIVTNKKWSKSLKFLRHYEL